MSSEPTNSQSRYEALLEALLNVDTIDISSQSRVDEFLYGKILG